MTSGLRKQKITSTWDIVSIYQNLVVKNIKVNITRRNFQDHLTLTILCVLGSLYHICFLGEALSFQM